MKLLIILSAILIASGCTGMRFSETHTIQKNATSESYFNGEMTMGVTKEIVKDIEDSSGVQSFRAEYKHKPAVVIKKIECRVVSAYVIQFTEKLTDAFVVNATKSDSFSVIATDKKLAREVQMESFKYSPDNKTIDPFLETPADFVLVIRWVQSQENPKECKVSMQLISARTQEVVAANFYEVTE